MPTWSVEAPSNIALIKYMGKKGSENRPTNSSLSYTLDQLKSIVKIEQGVEDMDVWEPMDSGMWVSPRLPEFGKKKFLNHWIWLKKQLGIRGYFTIRSANNFPSDCGMASSASSFAALTLCAHKVSQSCGTGRKEVCPKTLAQWSAKGSGSSCRSFFDFWVQWSDGEGVCPVDLPYRGLLHNVVVVSPLKKKVSSSEAHLKIQTSVLNKGRHLRAEQRMKDLIAALSSRDWGRAFAISWAEFWDIHTLFETSQPSFRYMSSESLSVLNKVCRFWHENKDGPLVTMDAGPNVHLLYREDQKDVRAQLNRQLGKYTLL